ARRVPRRRPLRVELRRRGAPLPSLHARRPRLGRAPVDGERGLSPGRRVAFVHDWLTGMRGGERVLERGVRVFPDADLHTLVWRRGAVSDAIERHRIRTSFLDRMPAADSHYRWFLPLFPRAIESLDLSSYDAVVSVSHAVAKGVRTRPGVPHVSIVLTPMRYVWDLEDQYFPPDRFPWPLSLSVRDVCRRLRRWDRATSGRPTTLVAISHYVAERIRRNWGRDSVVVHPHVDVERFAPAPGPRRYYLLAGAFAPYKRLDL